MEKLLTKYFWIVNLFTLAVVAFLLSDGSGQFIAAAIQGEPKRVATNSAPNAKLPRGFSSAQSWRPPNGDVILERHFFESTFDPSTAMELANEINQDEVPASAVGDLPLVPCTDTGVTLIATVSSRQDPSWSFATIQDLEGRKMRRVGDSLGSRTVSGVTWRYLFLRGSSDVCYVDLYQEEGEIKQKPKPKKPGKGNIKDGIRSISDTEKVVDRSVIDKLMADPTQFVKSVRVRPHKVDGQVVGFKLRRFRDGSPLALLGAKKGDVIHSVNGINLTSMDQALGAYQSLGSAGALTFSLTRNGKPMDINVQIN